MATYITLFHWTDQGVQNVKETVNRVRQATAAFEQMGGKIKEVYWTQGPYDLIAIFDFPDEETFTAALLTLARAGNVRGTTLRAFSADEMSRIVARIP